MKTQIKTMTKNKPVKQMKKEIAQFKKELSNAQKKINQINKEIQESTGEEQEILHKEILELKSSIVHLMAKAEEKEKQEKVLYEKFQKLFSDRNVLEDFKAMTKIKILELANKLKKVLK
jgi:chromosome segregation ATPase